MKRTLRCERGATLVEFVLCSFPMLFAVISLFWISYGMWQYHTLAEAVNITAREAAVHGAGCAGQTCATTVSQVVSTLSGKAIGIPASKLNVALTSAAYSPSACNPVTSCSSNTNAWPSLAGNTATTTDITIEASYQFGSPAEMWIPGVGVTKIGSLTLSARSTQPVVY
jgi:Flp pilus assembly protein TadG